MKGVEALARHFTGKQQETLGKLLGDLENSGTLTEHLAKAWKHFYWDSSNDGGSRHAMKPGQSPPTLAEAKLTLITSSAFINYLTATLPHKQ